ncbi:MAG: hypothetical protein KAU22_08460 [Desulfuromonadales bacterium]|nr:hypothetical protein [Desulfuromonadales bacterium]
MTTAIANVIAYALDEAKYRGQEYVPLAIDMAPVQPHTAQRKARTYESCHGNSKVAGLGTGDGEADDLSTVQTMGSAQQLLWCAFKVCCYIGMLHSVVQLPANIFQDQPELLR